jgi:dUTP pyrophosphatase
MSLNMRISKVRNVKTPNRGTPLSAGIDFYVPEDFEERTISPSESVLIPSGIKAQVPKGYALVAFNKSGVAVKKSLTVGACLVDEDYQGEIHVHLINVGYEQQLVRPGDKVAQFVLLPVNYANVEEVPLGHLYDEVSERGQGGFGSTGLR